MISLKGKRHIGCLTSVERVTRTTVELCMNAVRQYVQPLVIFLRVRLKAELMNGATPGTISACSKSDWKQSDIFMEWLHYFVRPTNPTADRHVLLIHTPRASRRYINAVSLLCKHYHYYHFTSRCAMLAAAVEMYVP